MPRLVTVMLPHVWRSHCLTSQPHIVHTHQLSDGAPRLTDSRPAHCSLSKREPPWAPPPACVDWRPHSPMAIRGGATDVRAALRWYCACVYVSETYSTRGCSALCAMKTMGVACSIQGTDTFGEGPTCTLEGNIKMVIGFCCDGDERPSLRVLHPNRLKLYGPPDVAAASGHNCCPVLTSSGLRTSPLHYENDRELSIPVTGREGP